MKYIEKIIGQVILQVHDHMEETGRQDSFERFPYLEMLARRYDAQGVAATGCLQGVQERSHDMPETKSLQEERYKALLTKLSGSEEDTVLMTAVNLALAATLVTEFAAYLNYYTGNRATLQLAYELCGEFCPDPAEVTKRWSMLQRAFQVEKKTPLHYANIEAGHEVLSYLTGDTMSSVPPCDGVERFDHESPLHPMYVREQLADTGAKLLARENAVLYLSGRGGRRFLVRHIAKRIKRNVLFVRTDFVCGDEGNKEYRLMQTLREAFLHSCIVCIHGGSSKSSEQREEETAAGVVYAVRVLSEAGIPVILSMEEAAGTPVIPCMEEAAGTPVIPCREEAAGRGRTARIELTPLSRAERALVWQGFTEQYDLDEDVEQCSIRYRMTASEIARAAAEWVSYCRSAGHERLHVSDGRAERLSDICYRILCTGETQKLGTVIRPRVRLSDLIVSEQTKKTLGEICCGAAQGYRIYEEWGLDQQYPYGRNVSVLLAGAPGTGKTMTAHVLAHEIGVPLYQVDLPHIMDKYIGETEKHLEQVFDFAGKTNMVLFFDEADALFAKRGEVTEGKDRYANMEVAYLLQRMEQFDGVVVLATNFYHHIDKAFLRRIKYVLKYQEPDEAMRKRLWESCLTPSLPRETIDTDYLANRFALSGGVIKNVIQSACIAAVYERCPLKMEHVLRAIRMEYEKMERSVAPELWGEYGYLME